MNMLKTVVVYAEQNKKLEFYVERKTYEAALKYWNLTQRMCVL